MSFDPDPQRARISSLENKVASLNLRLESLRGNDLMMIAHPDGSLTHVIELRDYFAGQALAGFCADSKYNPTVGDVATDCYALADAMLEERGK